MNKEVAPHINHETYATRVGVVYPVGGALKRVFDIIVASFILVLISPFLLSIAIYIKVFDRGPVFFGHARVGYAGQTFRCWKFRTMVPNSGGRLQAYLEANPEALLEWQATRKLKNDVRVTAIGEVLRRFSIDELPQLFNVVCGSMSLVGPRPIVSEEFPLYGDHCIDYMRTRPGLTGAWQISGRSDTSYQERVLLDAAYVQHWSFFRDLWIILRTVPAVLSTRGAC